MKRIVTGVFLTAVMGTGVTSVAQQPSSRERELEDLVRKLSQKVDSLESRLNKVDGASEKASAPVTPEEWATIKKWVSDDMTLRPFWKDGLQLTSNDGSISLKIGGRIQHDWGYFCEDGSVERRNGVEFDDGTEFRRARVYISGKIQSNIDFKAQYDFAGGDADFKDVYLGMSKIPHVGNVRVGQFKEPFSLEELTSSNYITFMERSLVNTFAPGRNVGVMAFNTMADKRMTWAAGFFRQTDSFGDGVGGRDYNVTARVTGLPVYEDGGKKLLHLGVAVTHQNYEGDRIRFRARPESHLSPRLVDTGTFSAEYGTFVGGEVAWVDGPFSVQGEYVHSFIESRNPWIGDPEFCALSMQASYFLTGEHRPYKTSAGAFDRVRPLKNLGEDGGKGAWEIAARYSQISLNGEGVDGGRLRDVTLGLNWYLNPSVRTMWNYVYADPSKGGAVNAFMWRFQVAF